MWDFFKRTIIVFSLLIATYSNATALPTDVFKRQYHVLILFFPQDESPHLSTTQKLITTNKQNLQKEKIIIMGVFQNRVELLHAPKDKKFGSSRSVANFIRHCLSVKTGTFRAILLNRIGLEKFRTAKVATFSELKTALDKS